MRTRLTRGPRTNLLAALLGSIVVLVPLALATSLASTAVSDRTGGGACQVPAYLTTLAAQARQDPRFAAAEKGLSFTLVYADEVGATTGVVNATFVKPAGGPAGNVTEGLGTILGGSPYYSPPRTELTFYSYGATPQVSCATNAYPGLRVLSVLRVEIPHGADGVYNFPGMSLSQTPGLFTNGTLISP